DRVIRDDALAPGARMPRPDVLAELLHVPVDELAAASELLVDRSTLDSWGDGLPATVHGGSPLHVLPRDIAYAWAARIGQSEDWYEGSELPGTAAQAQAFRTTREVVRQGLRILLAWGYIERSGSARVIAAGAHPLAPVLTWQREMLRSAPADLTDAIIALVTA